MRNMNDDNKIFVLTALGVIVLYHIIFISYQANIFDLWISFIIGIPLCYIIMRFVFGWGKNNKKPCHKE